MEDCKRHQEQFFVEKDIFGEWNFFFSIGVMYVKLAAFILFVYIFYSLMKTYMSGKKSMVHWLINKTVGLEKVKQ